MTDTLTETKHWTQALAIALCVEIENIAPRFGCHVALTGGSLYKPGVRKDADILFYRIRQRDEIDIVGLMGAMRDELGVVPGAHRGWVRKATYQGRDIDFFFPEDPEGDDYV